MTEEQKEKFDLVMYEVASSFWAKWCILPFLQSFAAWYYIQKTERKINNYQKWNKAVEKYK